MPSKREDRIAIALLALLVVVTFANVVFGGRSLIPSEMHNPLDPSLRGPNAIPIEYFNDRGLVTHPNVRDIAAGVHQSDPAREFFTRSLRRGELPFWDPYIGGGGPSFAALVPQYLFLP
ncbi:MAG: hypothetical protein JOZ54_00745, partial [Acidobacteria bacterium]|nr:hypothetical protein [Acidobacteriota bacterium]